jgi:hypothetical protein
VAVLAVTAATAIPGSVAWSGRPPTPSGFPISGYSGYGIGASAEVKKATTSAASWTRAHQRQRGDGSDPVGVRSRWRCRCWKAKRLGHRAVMRLSWLLLVASVAVLSLLYRAEVSADQAVAAANLSAGRSPSSAGQAPASVDGQRPGAEVLTRRAQAERAYAELSATGAPVNAGQPAATVGLGASYARALVAQFHVQPPVTGHGEGQVVTSPASAAIDSEQKR